MQKIKTKKHISKLFTGAARAKLKEYTHLLKGVI